MFVLKTFIDKYNGGRGGGKLFACFVDFKKAFDKVIHSGIKYKLLKYNISGHFYKILSDMYSKSQLCVKIGNYLTPNFNSPVGVRQGDAILTRLLVLGKAMQF